MNERTDGELLNMFRSTGDEQAFGELMRRHKGTVLGAARSVVGGSGAAEDILQATFLTLARKAGSLDGGRSLAGWLHHVAVCLARDMRRNEARRAVREKESAMIDVEPDTSPSFSEALLGALHEELAALSETYRIPVILHHIEGLSYEQAAAAIGCNVMTLGSNLTRAREKLRKRLAGRGVTLGMTALVAGLGQSASASELPAGFVASTCAAAGGGAVSAQVSALMESALKMLFWAKVKTVTAICAVAVLVGGAGVGVAVTLPLVLKPAATTATRSEPLSPADAWIRELLVRAEAGPWDALDLKQGVIVSDGGVWRADLRGEPAVRRIWQTDPRATSSVLFDTAKWRRGVVIGRVMLLPEGDLPAALAVPAEATSPWTTLGVGETYDRPNGNYLDCYYVNKESRYILTLRSLLVVNEQSRGVWYRFVMYFDSEARPGTLMRLVYGWPEDWAALPGASWRGSLSNDGVISPPDSSLGFGLMTKGAPSLWQGIKLVPLGPDMPHPPESLMEDQQVNGKK